MTTRIVFDEAGLDELFAGPDSAVGKFVAKKVVIVTRRAKSYAPVDTGRLRSSITSEMGQEGTEIVGRIGTNVHYAPHLEFGTRYMRACPFLRPALAAADGGADPLGADIASIRRENAAAARAADPLLAGIRRIRRRDSDARRRARRT